ncbi:MULTISPECIES: hypothetical protein [unclassified Bradyrhizobium]|uniref:hypothetical protein n=1 Tax=unclassified Bradyrhizobium TaxID=2631580 RepID=UPI0028EA8478|nr:MULTISPECIES: hypothetical protein [unclassified Bradyrhizobium]
MASHPSSKIDETLIEVVARAMVSAAGRDPDEMTTFEEGCWLTTGPRWKATRRQAMMQIAAFDAICDYLSKKP